MSRADNEKVVYLESETYLYRLDDHLQVVPVPLEHLKESMIEVIGSHWAYQSRVGDGILISSAFIGISIPSAFNKQPLCFETMIFNRDDDPCWTARYRTVEECLEGHHTIKELVEANGEAAWQSDSIRSIY